MIKSWPIWPLAAANFPIMFWLPILAIGHWPIGQIGQTAKKSFGRGQMPTLLFSLIKYRACVPKGHYSWIYISEFTTTVSVLYTDLRKIAVGHCADQKTSTLNCYL